MAEKAAHQRLVPVQSVQLKIKLQDPKGPVRDLGNIPRGAEIDCFAKTIERLEVDLPLMRQRANVWSLGDIQGLRNLPYPDEEVEDPSLPSVA